MVSVRSVLSAVRNCTDLNDCKLAVYAHIPLWQLTTVATAPNHEMICRFRLHGHRGGESAKANPPTAECANTNGDNEVWNLAQQSDHYDAIVAVMELRETLRNYVSLITILWHPGNAC